MSECEQVSDDVLGFVSAAGELDEDHARRLQTRLAGLEHRVTDLASSERVDAEQQRSLDDVAGLLISLRGATEAAMRLSTDHDAPEMAAAAGELVVIRIEDLRTALQTLGSDDDAG